MSSNKSPTGIKTKSYVQSNFVGLDSSLDDNAKDIKDAQPLAVLNNAYCDWRGQISRIPASQRVIAAGNVRHVRFYSSDEDELNISYAEDNGAFISLKSDKDNVQVEDVYPTNAIVTSTVFAGKAHITSQQGYMYSFDGNAFRQNESESIGILSPKYVCSVNRRLCVAGLIGRRTEVQLTRIDTDNVFPDDEELEEENVLRAGFIEIQNILGNADEIKGIAAFEQDRLAIFTQSKCLIYVIPPDITQWALDDKANINIGTISHNTIKQAGTDLIFCSERGVHTIQRSRENGIMVYADILSKKVDLIYRALLRQVTDKELINAVWDYETNQYHIFFPISSTKTTRLTLTMTGNEENAYSWSTSDFINASCGDVQGGRLVLGANGGVYEVADVEQDDEELSDVVMQVETPILWHGSMTEDKQSHGFYLHASGQGDLLVEITDNHGNPILAYNLEIEDDSDGSFPDNPVVRQYERRFEARYRGIKVKLTSQGKGLIRISAIGFTVRT